MENHRRSSLWTICPRHHSGLWKSMATQAFQEVLEIHCDHICPCQPGSLKMNISQVLHSRKGMGVNPSVTEAVLGTGRPGHPWSSGSTPGRSSRSGSSELLSLWVVSCWPSLHFSKIHFWAFWAPCMSVAKAALGCPSFPLRTANFSLPPSSSL